MAEAAEDVAAVDLAADAAAVVVVAAAAVAAEDVAAAAAVVVVATAVLAGKLHLKKIDKADLLGLPFALAQTKEKPQNLCVTGAGFVAVYFEPKMIPNC